MRMILRSRTKLIVVKTRLFDFSCGRNFNNNITFNLILSKTQVGGWNGLLASDVKLFCPTGLYN